MRIWPYRICPPTFLHKIFSSGYYIPAIRPRNCTPIAPTMGIPSQQPRNHACHGFVPDFPTSHQPSLRVIPKRTRVNRIMIISLNKTNDFDSLNYEYTHNYQMALIYTNTLLAFTISLLGLLLYRSHLISSLLCLEGIILSMFVIVAVIILNTHLTTSSMMPIILLVFAACEAALGLSLLVMVSNTYGIDHVQNLNLLQC